MSWFRPSVRPSVLEQRLRSRVIVTLHSGESFAGVLVEADERAWVLREATAVGVGERGSDLLVDGEIVVLTENVAFAQRP